MTSMRRFVLRRLGTALLSLIGVTIIAFALSNVVPSDPALTALGPQVASDPAAVKAYNAKYGLNKSLPEQYLTYVDNLLHGNLGVSRVTQRPVLQDLEQYAPASIELGLVAVILALVLGVALGTLGAVLRDTWIDHTIRVGSLAGVSMPVFWLALVAYYVFSFKLGIFPGLGRLPPGVNPPPHVTGMYTVDALIAGQWKTFLEALTHILLPALVLAAYALSVFTRFTRSAVLDVLGQDFVRTARAKGLSELVVAWRHVLRAALVPIITVAGVMFGIMLSGTVFVESVFAWPGIGLYAFNSATNLDVPAVLGVTIVIALVYIVINFVVDLLYGFLDPRIRLQ
jgi:ABC-type dipeptide/oligopeptide/nickel transport system permease component